MKGTCDINIKTFKKIILAILILLVWELIILGNKVYADNEQVEISDVSFKDIINSKQNIKATSSLPTQYDLRKSNPYGFSNHGNVNITVEDQVGGTCWDYASMMSLQTFLAVKNKTTNYPVFSKAHIDYMISSFSGKDYGVGRTDIGTGGGFGLVLNYFYYNDGPIYNNKCYYTRFWNSSENKYDYTNERVTINGTEYINNTTAKKKTAAAEMDKISPDYYVHETVRFPSVIVNSGNTYHNQTTNKDISYKEFEEIRNTVKTHIMNNGGVWCSLRTHKDFIGKNLGSPYNTYDGKYSQYDNGTINGDFDGDIVGSHAITIIGWDDNYSKNKFNAKNSDLQIVHPPYDGAWLIVNNYGDGSFENGCQWISYYDYYINSSLYGFISVDQTQKYYTYKFNSQKAYEYMKGRIGIVSEGLVSTETLVGDITATDNTKTIKALDLVFNNQLKSFDFYDCDVSDDDLQVICSVKLPNLTKLKVRNSNISNISPIYIFKDTLKELNLNNNNIKDIRNIITID